MKKYIIALLISVPFIGTCQLRTGLELGVLISGSKAQKQISPSSAWNAFVNIGYKINRFNILSGIGYSSYQCENKQTIFFTDNLGNKYGAKDYIGYYTSNYLSIPLSLNYDLMKDKVIVPIVGIGFVNNIKVSNSFESSDVKYTQNESIKAMKYFIGTFASIGLKAKVSYKIEFNIKARYQYNTSHVFYSKVETLSFNGVGANIGIDYIF